MNFDLGSDLHLGFGGISTLKFPPTSDILVLSGDVVEVELLKRKSGLQRKVIDYLCYLNESYKVILMVMGNHEHYGNSFSFTLQNLRTQFKKYKLNNFVILEKETYDHPEAIFFGATLWTTMKDMNPLVMMQCQDIMNDYISIHVGVKRNKVSLTPEGTAMQCYLTLEKLKKFISLKYNKPKVLITHMAPSRLSLLNEPKVNDDAYYEELFELLVDSDLKVAVHGHLHDAVDYKIGTCRVVSNPRGYYGYESKANSFKFKNIKVS